MRPSMEIYCDDVALQARDCCLPESLPTSHMFVESAFLSFAKIKVRVSDVSN